jgi:hypothetical protein
VGGTGWRGEFEVGLKLLRVDAQWMEKKER